MTITSKHYRISPLAFPAPKEVLVMKKSHSNPWGAPDCPMCETFGHSVDVEEHHAEKDGKSLISKIEQKLFPLMSKAKTSKQVKAAY